MSGCATCDIPVWSALTGAYMIVATDHVMIEECVGPL